MFGPSSELNKILEIQPNVFYHCLTANSIAYNGEVTNVNYILIEKHFLRIVILFYLFIKFEPSKWFFCTSKYGLWGIKSMLCLTICYTQSRKKSRVGQVNSKEMSTSIARSTQSLKDSNGAWNKYFFLHQPYFSHKG